MLECGKHFDKDFRTPTGSGLAFVVVERESEYSLPRLACIGSRSRYTAPAAVVAGALAVEAGSRWPKRWQSLPYAVNGRDPRRCSQTKIPRP